jgi:hypothetical protein
MEWIDARILKTIVSPKTPNYALVIINNAFAWSLLGESSRVLALVGGSSALFPLWPQCPHILNVRMWGSSGNPFLAANLDPILPLFLQVMIAMISLELEPGEAMGSMKSGLCVTDHIPFQRINISLRPGADSILNIFCLTPCLSVLIAVTLQSTPIHLDGYRMSLVINCGISNVWILVSLATAATSLVILRALCKPRTQYRYPPGPKGIPIFGNLFQLPPKYPGEKLLEWGKQYGDMSVPQILRSAQNRTDISLS